MTAQLYLIKISAMCTSGDCDVVPSAEVIVDSDFGTREHNIIEALHKLSVQLAESLKGDPLKNIRPMTREEISTYRDERNEEYDETIRII